MRSKNNEDFVAKNIMDAIYFSMCFRQMYPTCLDSLRITRVDFVPRKIQGDKISTDTKSAFIHIEWAYLDEWMDSMRDRTGQIKIRAYSPITVAGCSESWIILPAHNPIADTNMNIHQLAENNRLLEQKVARQEEVIKNQSASMSLLVEEMKAVNEKINRLQEVLY